MARKKETDPVGAGLLFVVSAPSGAGKTTLVGAVTRSDKRLRVSVSHTTRPPRAGERNGVSYHFVDAAEFQRMVDAGDFLEHARVFGHHYGTSASWVRTELDAGRDVILEIDWQGARQIRALMPDTVSIFILPPSLEVLERRLRSRGDDGAAIQGRMEHARAEISHYSEYDFVIVNDALEEAIADLAAVIRACRRRYALHRASYDASVSRMLRPGGDFQ